VYLKLKTNEPENARDSGKKIPRVISRRQVVQLLVSLGLLGTVVSFLSLLMSLLPTSKGRQPQGAIDDVLRFGADNGTWYSGRAGSEVQVKDFDQVGKGANVLWRGSISAVIIRVDESKLRGTKANNGLIAFSTSCTHLCCVATWHVDRPNEDVIYCRCHDGVFDPYDVIKDVMPGVGEYLGAKVIAGPPPRALPLLPIQIKDGKVLGAPSSSEIFEYCQ
jgi:Rieske Fe-S protein